MCYFVVLADSKDVDISVVSSSAASTFDLEKLGWRALGFCKGARGCCKGLTGFKKGLWAHVPRAVSVGSVEEPPKTASPCLDKR